MKLIVVGAGPKAAAVAARAAAWRRIAPSRDVPDVQVLEQYEAGAAWSGGYGFSDGFTELCNAGEKDVGFPYPSGFDTADEAKVSLEVARHFSWFAFLTHQGLHTEWVERGRQFPPHALWARYIVWVFKRAEQPITSGRVKSAMRIGLPNGGSAWSVEYVVDGSSQAVIGDALMLTGTGPANQLKGNCGPEHGMVDAASFWDPALQKCLRHLNEGTIAVVGNGGAAGTILAHLAEMGLQSDVDIVSVSPLGAFFPRGDGYAERRVFSDASEWPDLPIEVRRAFLSRTEAGVVSARIKAAIDRSHKITFIYGRGDAVRVQQDKSLALDFTSGTRKEIRDARVVVAALGFDPWGLLRIIPGGTAMALYAPADEGARKVRQDLEEEFGSDLALPASAGIGPGLHVPTLAALAQGPGYATLGCLGTTASAVLDLYVS